MPEFHVDFVNWLSGYGVDDIDLRSVLATMSLYNVFRATPEFIAKRDAVKADRATKTKPEKDLSTLTPAEAKAELEKIQAAQVAAQQRQAKQAERAAAIQAMLAEAGVSTASDADGEAVDEVAVDEETAEAF
jgi:hypothetical protein